MITVIAGVNGAGKSSIAGEHLRHLGTTYYNPDEAARILLTKNPITPVEANGRAWEIGFQYLNAAIDLDDDYAFETTLGGSTIFQSLMRAISLGRKVSVFFVGLDSPELHIDRVRNRVLHGGHPIDETKIRERWEKSRANMAELITVCHSVNVFDNSLPLKEDRAQTRVLFKMKQGVFVQPPVPDMPTWAKPLAASAIKRCFSSDGT